MELKFHLENSSIVLIIKDENGTILKSSCRLEEDFYNMIPLGDDVYFDNNSMTISIDTKKHSENEKSPYL